MVLHAETPASALQEQPFSRNAEDARGFFDAPVRLVERALDHRLLEQFDGGRRRLIDPDAYSGSTPSLAGMVRRDA